VRTLWKPDSLLDVVFPITFYPGVTNELAAAEVNLTAGDMQVANIPLQAIPPVHLRLTNLPRNAENNFTIGIGANQKLFGSMVIGLNFVSKEISPGEFEVAGLPPGEVTFVVNGGGNQEMHSRTIKANVSGGETLDGAETGGLASVSGRVISSAGEAIPGGGRVMFFSDDGQNASALLRKDGTFSFSPLQEGTYKINVNALGGDEYVKSISATGAKVSGREITVAGASDAQISIAMGRGQGEVTGVAKLDGKPAAGMMVLLAPASAQNLEEDSRLDQSDSDGTFALHAISPGKYSLLAIEDGWDLDWTNAAVLKPYLEKAQPLQISASDQLKVTVEVQHKQ
jgi:carboxypeptidase family protein